MLKSIAVILFISLLFQTQARDFYYISENRTTAFYQCYRQQGYNHVTLPFEPFYPKNVNGSFQNMVNAKSAGLELGVQLILCRTMTPEQQVNTIVKNMELTAIN